MTTLFNPSLAGSDPIFLEYRDSPERPNERAVLEEMWSLFAPYSDPNFLSQLSNDFFSRYWELALGATLVKAGVSLKQNPGSGPDFRIKGNPDFSIEAIAPSRGDGSDAVPDLEGIFGNRKVGTKPNKSLILRIRTAIRDKERKYKKYFRNGTVSASEPYVIALNLLKSELSAIDSDPPLLLRSTLGLGEPMAFLDPGGTEVMLEQTSDPVIYKANGKPVRTDIFLTPEYSGISAILLSFNKPQHRRFPIDLRMIHNPHAKNCLQRGVLPVWWEYWLEGGKLYAIKNATA